MLIIEGPDNSGKTTLAKKIAEAFSVEYRRPPTLSSRDGVDSAVPDWWDVQLEQWHEAVYDRCFYISDPIYRAFHSQDEAPRTDIQMGIGIQNLVKRDAIIVFCLPPWEWSLPYHQAELEAGTGLKYAHLDDLRCIHWMYSCTAQLWSEADYTNVKFYDPYLDEGLEKYHDLFMEDLSNNYDKKRRNHGTTASDAS